MSRELKRQLKLINENLETFKENYHIQRLGIFGSVARGAQKRKSDVDILVEFKEPIGIFKFIELESNLTKLLKRKVDLVSKDALKPILKDSILKEVIYA